MKRNILDYIKYISRRNLIAPCIVLAVIAVLLFALPFRAVLLPEEVTTIEEIHAAAEAGDRYVHLEVDNLVYTGYDLMTGQKTKASYYYLLSGSADGSDNGAATGSVTNSVSSSDTNNADNSDTRCVFFLLPAGKSDISYNEQAAGGGQNPAASNQIDPSNTLPGGIRTTTVTLPHFSGNARIMRDDLQLSMFLDGFAQDTGWTTDNLMDICGGMLISCYDYHAGIYIALLVLMGLVALLSLIYIVVNLVTLARPTMHEACRRLNRFGLDNEDFRDIDRELAHDCIINAGNLFATYHYLIAFAKHSIYVVPLFNIVWAYKYATWSHLRRKSHMHFTMVIVTSPKDTIRVPGCKKKDVDRILQFLDEDFARIIVGYSEENRAEVESML